MKRLFLLLALLLPTLPTALAGSNCALVPTLEKEVRATASSRSKVARAFTPTELAGFLPGAFHGFARRAADQNTAAFAAYTYRDAQGREARLSLEDGRQATVAETLTELSC